MFKSKNEFIDFMQSIVVALAVSIFLFVFIITPNEVEGSSMEPNFHTGERLYTNKLPHWLSSTSFGRLLGLDYERGEVVVLQIPGMAPLIKRIIALPGETLELSDGHFYINGSLLHEDYLAATVITDGGSFLKEGDTITVPDDSFFVSGDNRPVSNDSRYLGFIKRDWIVGKPVIRIWPIDKFGTI